MLVTWENNSKLATIFFSGKIEIGEETDADLRFPECRNLKEVDERLNRIGSRRRTKWQRNPNGFWQAKVRRIETKHPRVIELRVR